MKATWNVGLVTLMMCGMLSAASGEQQVVKIWPEGKIPLKTSDSPEKSLPANDNIIRLTDINVPSLTVYPAEDTGKPNAAVMICPGGGYSILAWDLEGTEIAAWLNKLGISAFVLKYRVPNNRDASLCDAQRAMGLIRAKAQAFNIDSKRLGIMGFSAGAHLSVRTSTNFEKRFYESVDEADAQPCRPDFALIIYPAYLFTAGYKMAPELPVTEKTPPTFLIQAEDDGPYVDSSLAYYVALKAAKVPAELHLFPAGGHGYGIRKHNKPTDAWPESAADWLKRICGEK